jgi:sodium-dependent dicarboxylate transporter 2/3/5
MAVTAFLSMWLSNIAAAALVLACLRPALSQMADDHVLRRAILVGVALSADIGGIATPIGTGPNAIAIGAIAPQQAISFINWMIFGSPLAAGMILLAFFMLRHRTKGIESEWKGAEILSRVRAARPGKFSAREIGFLFILIVTSGMWLTEPLHKIPSAVVALGAAVVLFVSGILDKRDLLRIDWSTLFLIAGGITLGRLLEQTGIVHDLAASIPFSQFNATVSLFILCLTSAALSALMSNTATAVMLIPLAMALIPYPSTAILIAVSASFGLPFMISTPQNSMVFGEGGLRFKDLFLPGIIIMLVGCLVVSLTGRMVLNVAGIP